MNDKNDEAKTMLTRRVFLKQGAQAAVALPVAGALLNIPAGEAAAARAPAPAPAPTATPAPTPAPASSRGMRYLFAQRANCTGCRACEYACSQYHDKDATRPAASRILIRRYKSIVDVPIICWHCEDAPCVKSCPTSPQAIKKDRATNIISYIDDKTCLGAKCNKCIEACPAKYLRRHPDTGRPMFCDLCGGDPQCVNACEQMAAGELAPTLLTKKSGGGVNLAYRDVTPEEAADALIGNLFHPNKDGSRR
ncbi:MAG: 4Fe-4S dicluster domain-containing protein [Deltaproteobacteria bacterium]|jgi:Fe-S-cluster-containing hydrogenase component 2|nr:4Fe-4S dicluster domain-containing protein [Deltaproteobacteria bacterium]